ncbi:MAG: hypothetical protein JJT75_08855 [Opitutales bacterium]|nr:hypothetical protein [Opitutales bacterium]MCH8539692.1 hypothetical protein [Opitutales bacterium]
MLSLEESNQRRRRLAEFLHDQNESIHRVWFEAVQESDAPLKDEKTLRQTVAEHLAEIKNLLQNPSYSPPKDSKDHDFRHEANIILRGEEAIASLFQETTDKGHAEDQLKDRHFINRVFCHYLQIRCGLCSVLPFNPERTNSRKNPNPEEN